MNKSYYLDYAATTPLAPEVLDEMLPYMREYYGNASSVYDPGLKSRTAISRAKEQIARVLRADRAQEIYFTSGGTESNNWVLRSICDLDNTGTENLHIITTQIEHHSVLNTCQYLEKKNVSVTYLQPDKLGRISPEQVEAAIRPETALISVMFANNEIGTIQPIAEIGKIAEKYGVLFHCDAVQAFGHEPIDVNEMKIDYLSASGHKLRGPKGIGFLYMRKGKVLPPLLYGGAQENNRRAGTENVPAIVGFGKAAMIAQEGMEREKKMLTPLRDQLCLALIQRIPDAVLNGDAEHRLANNISLYIPGIEGEILAARLSEKGIYASSGSACASGAAKPSHVLKAIGYSHAESFSQLRLTIGQILNEEEINAIADIIAQQAESLLVGGCLPT